MNTQSVLDSIKKIPLMGKIALSLSILLIISMIAFRRKHKEGFMQTSDFIMKEGPSIFDGFYSSIYDAISLNEVKNDFEIEQIINKTSPDNKSIILDIGSGTGHHVGALSSSGLSALGVDISPDMVSVAKDNYPHCNFKVGDATDTLVIQPESVTHVLCLNMTIYYIKDKRRFFQNCFNWLMPGGYLAIHLVNKDRFTPIRSDKNNRQLETRTKFDDFEYKGQFEVFPNDLARYKEIFVDDRSKTVRQNNHTYYLLPQKKILAEAQDCGFISLAQIDLLHAGYDYQYIYILQKPN